MSYFRFLLHQRLVIITNAFGYQMTDGGKHEQKLRILFFVLTVRHVYLFILSTICNNIINLHNSNDEKSTAAAFVAYARAAQEEYCLCCWILDQVRLEINVISVTGKSNNIK